MNLMIKFQNTGQQAQYGGVSSKPSYVHGNVKDTLMASQGGTLSTPLPQVHSGTGGPVMGFGSNLPPVASQIPLGSDGSRFSGNQSKPIPIGIQNGGSWMIPTPGLNVSNPPETFSNRASTDASSNLLYTTGSGPYQHIGKVIETSKSTSNQPQIGNTGILDSVHAVGQEHGFVKETYNISSSNPMQQYGSLSGHASLQQQSYGKRFLLMQILPSDGNYLHVFSLN